MHQKERDKGHHKQHEEHPQQAANDKSSHFGILPSSPVQLREPVGLIVTSQQALASEPVNSDPDCHHSRAHCATHRLFQATILLWHAYDLWVAMLQHRVTTLKHRHSTRAFGGCRLLKRRTPDRSGLPGAPTCGEPDGTQAVVHATNQKAHPSLHVRRNPAGQVQASTRRPPAGESHDPPRQSTKRPCLGVHPDEQDIVAVCGPRRPLITITCGIGESP